MRSLKESTIALEAHIAKCEDSAYEHSPIVPENIIFDPALGKGMNMGSTVKYLSRYCGTNGEKKDNPMDLLKAAHYILMEFQRVSNEVKKAQPKNDTHLVGRAPISEKPITLQNQ